MIFLLPLLIGVAYLAGRRAVPQVAQPNLALVGASFDAGPPASAKPPCPLVVLDAFLRLGQVPPPPVIMCAIAQAELLGRVDLVEDIVRAFVLPVVRAAQAAPATPMPMPPMMPMPESAAPWGGSLMPMPSESRPGQVPAPPPWAAPPATPPIPGAPGSGSGPRPIGRPEDVRVEVIQRDEAPRSAAPRAQSSAGTITVSGRSCPIEGVDAQRWEEFAARVAREQPTFSSPRHVGQFRQRRDRLAELGIDPASVAESPQAQIDAFAQDMGDAHRHAQESGLVAEYRGMTVEIPNSDGQHVPIEVTLSGVLGVIQAAGLEGAAEWLEKPNDRVRFPQTTAAFRRTNGVF
jgi:hypothetical protein